jgi:hypothetical protein
VHFSRPVFIGVAVGAAVAILITAGVIVGFQLGRGSPEATPTSQIQSPAASSPTSHLVVASAASLLPDTSDFPGVYVAIGQSVGGAGGNPGESETLRGINGNPLSASAYITIYPTIAGAQERYQEVITLGSPPPGLLLPRRYGDEAKLFGQPATSSVSQLILQWRDRNVVAGVTIYDNSGSVGSQAMTTGLFAIADLFSARIAAA